MGGAPHIAASRGISGAVHARRDAGHECRAHGAKRPSATPW